jgi:hypothetical protein
MEIAYRAGWIDLSMRPLFLRPDMISAATAEPAAP